MSPSPTFAAVLPAGGVGSRFGADRPKQFLELAGKALWRHSLECFLNHPQICQIVLVSHPEWVEHFRESIALHYSPDELARVRFALGGAERWISVQNGIQALDKGIDFALVHDVARPLLPREILDHCLATLQEKGACLVAKAATDTIKLVENALVKTTLDRNWIYLAQTPQAFRIADLQSAYTQMPAHPEFCPTDEAGMMEFFNYPVPIIPGSELNDKVTTPDDLERLEWLYHRRGSHAIH